MRLIITNITFYLAALALNNLLGACGTTWLRPAGAPLRYVPAMWRWWSVPAAVSCWHPRPHDRQVYARLWQRASEVVHRPHEAFVDHCAVYKTLIFRHVAPDPPHPPPLTHWRLFGVGVERCQRWALIRGICRGWRLEVEDDGSRGRRYIRGENGWQLDLSSLARPCLSDDTHSPRWRRGVTDVGSASQWSHKHMVMS